MSNLRVKLILVFFGLALACNLMSQANVRFSDEEIEAVVNPVLADDAELIVKFDSTVCNIGSLTEDDAPKKVCFSFTNVSEKPVIITMVRTNCGCTLAEVDVKTILPGEKGRVVLKYVPKNHPGTIDTNAFVYIEGLDKKPVAKLTLLGNVLPGKDQWSRFRYAMGKLRLKRNSVYFDEVCKGMNYEERILCGNSGKTPLKLSAVMLPSFVTFRTEPEVIEPGCEADIVITIDESKIPSEKNGYFSFPVIVEGIHCKPSDRSIEIKVNRKR